MEMPEAPMRSRRRRLSQHAHWLSQEEIAYYDDSESKSISREPTTANEEEDDDEEEEEKEDEEEDEEEEEEEEDDDDEELAPESSMEQEKELFDRHRQNWEFTFSHPGLTFDVFTSLSSMVFTHCTPSCIPPEAVLARTLQMMMLARSLQDPYLHLTGPRRGLLSIDPVHIEIQLRLKQGQSRSEDRALVTQAFRYDNPSNCDWFHSYLSNYLCQIELCLEQLTRSRQATVLSVRVTRGSPFRYGGQILCCASPYEDDPCKMIVLFDSKYGKTTTLDSDGTMSMDPDGYLDLSRRVVSVQGRLKIFINTYSRSGAISASGRVSFRAKDCQTSQAKCFLHKRSKASKGNSAASEGKDEVKINVAWSRFARKISAIELDCFGDL
ncbi:hypothetical protein ACQ4PT_065773 [Festuca glaucescens]